MNAESALKILNIASSALDLLGQYNISEQKFIDLRAAKNGEPINAADLMGLSTNAQAAIDSIQS